MAGALGERYRLQIEVSGVLTDISCQGDLTFNTGKSLEVSRTKQCKHPFFRESGYSATVTVELENPISATQSEVITAANDEATVGAAVVSSDTGMPKWTGVAYWAYDPLTAPTEGIATIEVTATFVNDPTYSTS